MVSAAAHPSVSLLDLACEIPFKNVTPAHRLMADAALFNVPVCSPMREGAVKQMASISAEHLVRNALLFRARGRVPLISKALKSHLGEDTT